MRMEGSADIAIIGGGAAGLATAIFAARRLPHRSIVVVEATRKPGAKILLSGGGRCNVTNAVVAASDYRGGSPNTIRKILSSFPVDKTVQFFRGIDVSLHEEEAGKLFPDTNRAATVRDALLREAGRLGVHILMGHRASQVKPGPARFELSTSGGNLNSHLLVLATGGLSVPSTGSDGSGYGLAESLGHSLIPTTPALVPLVLDGHFHTSLSGISHEAELTIRIEGAKPLRFCGALLWTHFGLSGPVVLDASRFWLRARQEAKPVSVSLSFLPGDDFRAADKRLLKLATDHPRMLLRNALATLLPAQVAGALLKDAGIRSELTMIQLTREHRRSLVHALTEKTLTIRESRGYPHAEVTAGGVPLDEIEPGTMASRKCAGLFLVGEMLDVDGRIGGFNFQWAWASAWVAAAGIAEVFSVRGADGR